MEAVLSFLWQFLAYTWWLWAFFIILPATVDIWLSFRQKVFEHDIKWAMLEIMIPREIQTSPKAMEQVFSQIYNFRNYPGNIKEKWWIGEVTLWHSFEVVGLGGEVHFYVRTPKAYRDLMEAALFAFYPDIEINEAEDYMKQFPSTVQGLYESGYKMWGTEMILEKSAAYPLRSYEDFESPDENKQYDPMSAFLELFSKLKPGQMAALQILCWPAMAGDPHDEHAFHSYQEEIIKVRERKNEHGPAAKTKVTFHGPLPVFETASPHEDQATGVLKKAIMTRTPGETDILKAMDENLSRPLFNTTIRYIYASPLETYSEHLARRAMFGAFNQYSAQDLNGLKRNKRTQTRGQLWEAPFLFPDLRKEFRRQHIWHDFRHREIPPHHFWGRLTMSYLPFHLYFGSESIHLNSRSLASIWHPPTYRIMTGPHIRRVESRKQGPPAGVEIFGDEGALDRFN
jgi:hypothetical protein